MAVIVGAMAALSAIALPFYVILGGGYLLGWSIRKGWNAGSPEGEDAVQPTSGRVLDWLSGVTTPWWVGALIVVAAILVLLPIVLVVPAR